jgi:hypothetical protein
LIEIWTKATAEVGKEMEENFPRVNPVWMMVFSGARGNMMQIRQIAGMRGLVANPKGEISPRPINTKELPIILGFLKMADSAGIIYTDDEIRSLALLCDQLFSADFDSDGPYWARLEFAYNQWWMHHYANVHISMRPAQPRMNKDWIQGGTFFWHQLTKSWKDLMGQSMRMPQ